MEAKIRQIIEEKVRPSLQDHGGDIEFLDVTADGIVRVRLQGACSSCPGAQQTLANLVEDAIKAEVPEIKGVEAVHQVSEELIQQALKILRKGK